MQEYVHEKFMKCCLELASIAKSNNSTPVGSLIVEDNAIIAEGIEGAKDLPCILPHAEILAINNAIKYKGSNDLSNCVLYTTVEPCFMCSYLIRQMKIKEVIFGTTTPETGGVSSAFPLLTTTSIRKWHPPPIVIDGILKNKCQDILK